MKPINKSRAKSRDGALPRQADSSQKNRIHITFVSDKERETYRIPSYCYILP